MNRIDEIARERTLALRRADETADMLNEVKGIRNHDEDYLIALTRKDFAAAFVVADHAVRKLGNECNSVRYLIWTSRMRDMRVVMGASDEIRD